MHLRIWIFSQSRALRPTQIALACFGVLNLWLLSLCCVVYFIWWFWRWASVCELTPPSHGCGWQEICRVDECLPLTAPATRGPSPKLIMPPQMKVSSLYFSCIRPVHLLRPFTLYFLWATVLPVVASVVLNVTTGFVDSPDVMIPTKHGWLPGSV